MCWPACRASSGLPVTCLMVSGVGGWAFVMVFHDVVEERVCIFNQHRGAGHFLSPNSGVVS